MKKFKLIYKFGKSYGATIFTVAENSSYDEIVQKAIIKTISEKEKYFRIFPEEKNVISMPTITIIECDVETGRYLKDGIEMRVPWN